MLDYSPALMTDMYEYTMLDACLKDGTANRKCVFEIFTRHLPLGRHYGVAAGQGRILDALEKFHLDDNDLKFLADRKVVSPETIKWLENFHFSGSIKGYREGEMFFPNSPILQVEGTFGECTLLETLLLSILNYDSAVASAASRMATAAKDRPCMDMGGRRTNEWAAVAAARAAVVGGFKGTANLLAAQMYGLKAIGTAAHCFTLVHDDEKSAFESQIAALGKNTTLLVDTYNIEEAVKTAVEVAGPELGGVRIDSGDLASLAQRVRNQLDALGATNTKITVTNDLDEYALAALQTAPVDSYGVGTMLVTGSAPRPARWSTSSPNARTPPAKCSRSPRSRRTRPPFRAASSPSAPTNTRWPTANTSSPAPKTSSPHTSRKTAGRTCSSTTSPMARTTANTRATTRSSTRTTTARRRSPNCRSARRA